MCGMQADVTGPTVTLVTWLGKHKQPFILACVGGTGDSDEEDSGAKCSFKRALLRVVECEKRNKCLCIFYSDSFHV